MHKTPDLSLLSHFNNTASSHYATLDEAEANQFPQQPPQPMLGVGRIKDPPKTSTSSQLRMKRGVEKKKKAFSYKSKNIAEPHSHDVLCGRGASINNFVGNLRWRDLIKSKKQEYVQLHKLQRHILSESIVFAVRNLDPPGRFLQRDPVTGLWNDIGDQRAHEKTAQALREGASKLRQKIKADPKTTGEADKKLPAKKVANKATKKKRGDSPPFKKVAGIEEPGFASLPLGSSTVAQQPEAQVPVAARSSTGPFSLALEHTTLHSGGGASMYPQQDQIDTFPTVEDFFEPLPLELGHIMSSSTASHPSYGSASLQRFPEDSSLARGAPDGRRDPFWHARDMEPANQFPSNRQEASNMDGTRSLGFPLRGPFLEEQDSLLNHAADLILKDAAGHHADSSKGRHHDHHSQS